MDHYYDWKKQEVLYNEKTNYNIFNQLYAIIIQYNINSNTYFIKIGFDKQFRTICSKFVTNPIIKANKDPYKRNRKNKIQFTT